MTLVREYQPTFELGNGVKKEFPYLFDGVSGNFVKVIIKHLDGSTYVPVYTVDLNSSKIVLGLSEPAPLDTDVVCIYRETPDLQDTPFNTLQGYDAKALENILSKIVAMIQEIKSYGFSTQVLQGLPWKLGLLQPSDNGANVVIDYTTKTLKKGFYFRIYNDNLQVSADGVSWKTITDSDDLDSVRTLAQNAWNKAGVALSTAQSAVSTAQAAVGVARGAAATAQAASATANRAETKSDNAVSKSNDALTYAQQALDTAANIACRKYSYTTTAGQSTLTVGENLTNKSVDLYWNGVLTTSDWSASGTTITLSFVPDAGDKIVVMVGSIRQTVAQGDLDAHNVNPNAHANEFAAKATKVIVRRW